MLTDFHENLVITEKTDKEGQSKKQAEHDAVMNDSVF